MRYAATFGPGKQFAILAPLARLVFSVGATSTEAERAQSAAGRVCAPLRSRLSPDSVEQLTVIQQYIEKSGQSVKDIRENFLSYIERSGIL
jgi:hypothetical protein